MNRERIRLVAFPITVNGISTSNNNLIDLQGQNNGLQPQFTMQPQVTSFNPYQQQAQQEAMQVSTFTFSAMTGRLDRHLQAEWARQQQEWMMQQQQQQQQQLQLQAQQEEWMRHQLAQQQTAQQQALLAQQQQEFLAAQAQQQARIAPQPTAFGFVHFELFSFGRTDNCVNSSNNPFAATTSSATPVSSPQPPAQPALSSFSLPSTYESHEPPRRDYATPPQSQPQPAPAPSPRPTPQRSQTRADQEHAHLASLFAARDGDGIDTFGNVGALRYARSFPVIGLILMQCFFVFP